MDTREKLDLLGQAARYDDCTVLDSDEAVDGRGFFAPAAIDPRPPSRDMFPCVSHLTTPWGQRKAVLKVLQTSACQNDCYYWSPNIIQAPAGTPTRPMQAPVALLANGHRG